MRYAVVVMGFDDEPCNCGGKQRTETIVSLHESPADAHDKAWRLREKGQSAIVEEYMGTWRVGETHRFPC